MCVSGNYRNQNYRNIEQNRTEIVLHLNYYSSRDITYIYNYLQCWWQNRA